MNQQIKHGVRVEHIKFQDYYSFHTQQTENNSLAATSKLMLPFFFSSSLYMYASWPRILLEHVTEWPSSLQYFYVQGLDISTGIFIFGDIPSGLSAKWHPSPVVKYSPHFCPCRVCGTPQSHLAERRPHSGEPFEVRSDCHDRTSGSRRRARAWGWRL